jgi:hypothetical protein
LILKKLSHDSKQVEISNKVRLAFDRPSAEQSKSWVYRANRLPTGSNISEEMETPRKNRGLAFTEVKLQNVSEETKNPRKNRGLVFAEEKLQNILEEIKTQEK